MASGLLASSSGGSSIAIGGSYRRSKQGADKFYTRGLQFSSCTAPLVHLPNPIKGSSVTVLFNKTGKIENNYCVMMSLGHNLKYHYKGIEGRSTCLESGRKYVVNATSEQSFELEPHVQHQKSIWDFIKHAWNIFIRFNRPYAAIATAIGAISASLLAVESLSDLSPAFFIGLLAALVTSFCMNTLNCGLNQLCDVEIDKINKPNLPMASGEMSFRTGVIITATSFILNCWLAITVDSWPLFWAGVASLALGVVYNVNLPFLRWKKTPILAATSILLNIAVSMPLGFFFHMQTAIFKRPATFPRQLIFCVAMLSYFFVVIALYKDIPDMEGDKKFGVQSLSICLGEKRVFWICISLLEMAYGAIILAGTTSPFLWSKILTGVGHAILVPILWNRAKSVDLKSKESLHSFYMFLWQLLTAEYLLMPLFR